MEKITIGFGDYDRTRPLVQGEVKIEGAEIRYVPSRIITECFEAMVKDRAYEVGELGLSYFLRTMDTPEAPFLALPIFPNRCFRHSAIYINKSSGIRRPQDLKGKRVGEFAMYGHDAGVWPKGILADEYDVKPEDCRWVIGRLDWPLKPVNFVPQIRPAGIEITDAPGDGDLGAMLERGEIDALISADVPKCVLENSPKVGRLFEDFPAVERSYFQRTGIFPMMHLMAVKKDFAKSHAPLLQEICRGFTRAKDAAAERYTKGAIFNNMAVMMPWMNQLVEKNMEFFGKDWWPYGLEANRKAVDTFLRYHYAQGLSKKRLTCEDIFVKELLAS